jgi:hypothetical protein
MVIKGRGNSCKIQAARRPASSIPKREGSIYFDLQVLYSKKNVLQNIISICEAKTKSASHELGNIDKEIDDLETFIVTKRSLAQAGTGYIKSNNIISNNAYTKIKVVDMEY